MAHKILIVALYFTLVTCLMPFDKNKQKQKNESLKIMTTFEELDQIMSQSEFKKVWEKARLNIKNGEMVPELEDEFRKIRPEEII